jgi:hypothetical protein
MDVTKVKLSGSNLKDNVRRVEEKNRFKGPESQLSIVGCGDRYRQLAASIYRRTFEFWVM